MDAITRDRAGQRGKAPATGASDAAPAASKAGAGEARDFGIGEAAARLSGEFPDVTLSSLRFLEGEGLLVPRRTPGGHRLYGPAEVEQVRRIKRWQRDDRLSLAEIRARLESAGPALKPSSRVRSFLKEALGGRTDGARRSLIEAYEAGVPVRTLFRDVVGPVLREVGAGWEAGTLTVAQEHEVSAVLRDAVAAIAARFPAVVQPRGVVLAACVAGEEHELGLRMAAAALQAEGFRVHFLGADVPADAVANAVRDRQPAVLLLSATTSERLPALEDAVRAVASLPAALQPRVLVAGPGVEGAEKRLASLSVEHVASIDALMDLLR